MEYPCNEGKTHIRTTSILGFQVLTLKNMLSCTSCTYVSFAFITWILHSLSCVTNKNVVGNIRRAMKYTDATICLFGKSKGKSARYIVKMYACLLSFSWIQKLFFTMLNLFFSMCLLCMILLENTLLDISQRSVTVVLLIMFLAS